MIINISVIFALLFLVNTETPSGKTIVAKSIEFHDPNNNWKNLQAHLEFIESGPDGDDRYSSIDIDNIRGNFCSNREVNKMHVQRHIKKDSFFYNIDEYEELTDSEIIKYKLNKKQSFFLRNYYLYLWGLPMKLHDKDTQIEEDVMLTKFDNKEAYEVKVLYDKETGNDTWFFYFNPDNYALIGYRFYHDVTKNDARLPANQTGGQGEYILLKDSKLVCGIQIPKSRSWNTHQDSAFLGTDVLSAFDDLDHTHY